MSSKYIELSERRVKSSIMIELPIRSGYVGRMAKPLQHPEIEKVDLSMLLDALSDPVRRRIVRESALMLMNVQSSVAELTPA